MAPDPPEARACGARRRGYATPKTSLFSVDRVGISVGVPFFAISMAMAVFTLETDNPSRWITRLIHFPSRCKFETDTQFKF